MLALLAHAVSLHLWILSDMHWSAILTTLALSFISAWLVYVEGWSIPYAFGIVGVGAFTMIAALIGFLMLVAKPQDRKDLLSVVLDTVRDDFVELLRWMRLGR